MEGNIVMKSRNSRSQNEFTWVLFPLVALFPLLGFILHVLGIQKFWILLTYYNGQFSFVLATIFALTVLFVSRIRTSLAGRLIISITALFMWAAAMIAEFYLYMAAVGCC